MAQAKDIICPVEKCKAAIGRPCKLVDMTRHPFLGKYHLTRVTTARDLPNQTAEEVLSGNRVLNF